MQLSPNIVLNRSFLRYHETLETKEKFRLALKTLLEKLTTDEDEEYNKTWIRDFLVNTFYGEPFEINTRKKVDQAIYGPESQHPWVLIEMKSPGNLSEMPKAEHFDKKGLYQLVLYFMKEEKERNNNEIKHLAVTNGFEWYFFERKLFYHHFGSHQWFWNEINRYEREGRKRDEIYDEVIAPVVRNVQDHFDYVYLDLRKFSKQINDPSIVFKKNFETLCKFFSPTHLCIQPYDFDHNHLDPKFYNELLYLMGVEERHVGQIDVIRRLPEKQRQHYSLLEQTIWHLSEMGVKDEEELYDVALGLVISWVNRILFLKLLETQLVNFNEGDTDYKFLTTSSIKEYHTLFNLFFKVLSKTEKERDTQVRDHYSNIPYLNSALFEISEQEKQYFTINALPHGPMRIFPATVLKDKNGKVKRGELDSLEYLLRFLDSYDFGTYELEEKEEHEEEQKTLIDASVLGLIFEKINGYKEGAYFTPGFICEYICREVIERVAIEQLNKHFGWQCKTIEAIVERLDYYKPEVRREVNDIINNIKICDPSVGSGHFLVSALNEMIVLKSKLHVLEYAHDARNYAGQRVEGCLINLIDDELVVTDVKTGKAFSYNQNNLLSIAIQRTLFEEKRRIISQCLYGVDINPKSVDICRLRLWIELLKNAFYDNGVLQTLPNIDLNIKEGDALMSHLEIKVNKGAVPQSSVSKSIKQITEEYKRQVDEYKKGTGHINRFEIQAKLNKVKRELRSFVQSDFYDYEIARISRKDTEQHYLEWMLEFPELLNDDGFFSGFDIIVGNPPYISLGADEGKLRKRYEKRGYNTFNSNGDIYFLFYERALQLLRSDGLLCFITSNKWMRNDAAKQLRNHLTENSSPLMLIDFPGQNFFKRATVVNNILMAQKRKDLSTITTCATTEGKDIGDIKNIGQFVSEHQIPCQFHSGQQWLILPDEKRSIMQKMREKGKPLGEWGTIKFARGVVTGRNDAFIITTSQRDDILASCKTEEERQRTEDLLHPFIEGCDIHRYGHQWNDKWVIGFYPSLNLNIEDYPTIKHHLLFYAKDWLLSQGLDNIANNEARMAEFGQLFLEQNGKPVIMDGQVIRDAEGQAIKSRKHTSHKWFETSDNIAFHDEFSQPKIVWGNLNNRASCTWIAEDMHINAPAVMVTPGNKYLLAALNSSLADFFMQSISVVRNAGYYEYKPQFVKQIPIIEHPVREDVVEIEKLADRALQGDKEAEEEIDMLFARMYGLTTEEYNVIKKQQ